MTTSTTERSVVDVLRAARERIEPEDRWTTNTYARNGQGMQVEPNSDAACRWCASGAVLAELGIGSWDDFAPAHRSPEAFNFLLAAASEQSSSVAMVNDRRGHDAVLNLFDRAIQLAEAEA